MKSIESIIIRKATRKDAADLAIIDNMSSHGMSLEFWQHAVVNGEAEDALVYARDRFSDADSIFGWSNAFVAENEDEILGSITVYEMPEPDEDVDMIKRVFPGFVPVFELFGKAVGNWFIDSLGVFPKARTSGVGGKLLDAGLKRGKLQGFSTASLVVENENAAAVQLYKSRGFSVALSLPMIEENATGDWLLMNAKLG